MRAEDLNNLLRFLFFPAFLIFKTLFLCALVWKLYLLPNLTYILTTNQSLPLECKQPTLPECLWLSSISQFPSSFPVRWSDLNLTVTFCQHMQARAARAKSERDCSRGVCVCVCVCAGVRKEGGQSPPKGQIRPLEGKEKFRVSSSQVTTGVYPSLAGSLGETQPNSPPSQFPPTVKYS